MAENAQEVVQQMKDLGHDRIDLPPGTDIADFADGNPSPEPAVSTEQEEVPSEQVDLQDIEPVPVEAPDTVQTEKTVQTEGTEAELTPEERARRWQSTADKAKAELERERMRAQIAQEQAEAMRVHAEYLKQQYANMQPPKPQAQVPKRPEVQDFIVQGSWDPAEAGDPSTPSGQAMLRYNEALADWKVDQRLTQERRKWEQEQQTREQEQLSRRKAMAFVNKFPEFKNPLTGEPDYPRIQQALTGLMSNMGDDEWARYYEVFGKNGGGSTAPPPTPMSAAQMTQQINKAASKPSSVAAAGVVKDTPAEVPKELKNLQKFFGDKIDLPPDYGG